MAMMTFKDYDLGYFLGRIGECLKMLKPSQDQIAVRPAIGAAAPDLTLAMHHMFPQPSGVIIIIIKKLPSKLWNFLITRFIIIII